MCRLSELVPSTLLQDASAGVDVNVDSGVFMKSTVGELKISNVDSSVGNGIDVSVKAGVSAGISVGGMLVSVG
jgi:hypothetical protein